MSDERKPATPTLTEWQVQLLENHMTAARKAVRSILDLMRDSGLLPPPMPTDPRERALHLRKHRNTGPGKPIQEQRRRR